MLLAKVAARAYGGPVIPPRSTLLAASIVLLVGAPAAQAVPTGALRQLSGKRGCVSERGHSGCSQASTLAAGGGSLVQSPDGRSLYALNGQVVAFARDRRSGALGQRGCLSREARTRRHGRRLCSRLPALRGTGKGVVSADGRNLYVTTSDGIVAMGREPSGRLRALHGQGACLNRTGRYGCAAAPAINGPGGLTVSHDGKNAYLASYDGDAIVVLGRNPATGALHQLSGAAGCVNEDGRFGCSRGRAVAGASDVVASRDGRFVYAATAKTAEDSLAGDGSIDTFARDPATGALTQLPGAAGCIGTGPVCGGPHLGAAVGLAPGPRDRQLYALTYTADRGEGVRSSEVDVLARNGPSGALSAISGPGNCVGDAVRCRPATVDGFGGSLSVTRDGKSIYTVAGSIDALGVVSRSADGSLTALRGREGCIQSSTTYAAERRCRRHLRAFEGLTSVVASPDGRFVYVGGRGIAAFSRHR